MTRTILLGCILILLLISCDKFHESEVSYTYHPPVTTEFEVSSLSTEGLDETLITELTNKIVHEEYKRIDGLLIFKNNQLVYENYFHGYDHKIRHNMYSSSKSITSILIGIAIDKGFIENINMPIVDLLPEYAGFKNPDTRKNNITIAHLLNMQSGLDCEDWYKGTETSMDQAHDAVKFTLDLPMLFDPGTIGQYCTGNAITLGRIIENQSKMSLEEFANQYLFKPLNIQTYKWNHGKDGKIYGGGKLFLRPRDMAKIGLLMLNDGVWKGEQIVAREWVTASSQNFIKLPGPFDGYGYLWWKQAFEPNIETYFAAGNGGQDIFIIPSKNIVLVFTTGNKNTSLGLQNIYMIRDYILPAIQ